jgi:hypothetical protein
MQSMHINGLQLTPLKYIATHNDIRNGTETSPKPIVSRRKSEIIVMTSARTMTSSRDTLDGTLRRGLSRFVGELAAGFEAIFEIFAEAGDGSTEARARFPFAD